MFVRESRQLTSARIGGLLFVIWLMMALGLMACGSDQQDSCTPGQTADCVCSDGASGAQMCLPDETFGACACGQATEPSDGGRGESDSGRGESDSGGNDFDSCVSEMQRECRDNEVYEVDSCSGDSQVVESCEHGCDDGECAPCQPDCQDLECGDDPLCGESCGSCSDVDVCTDAGQCNEADSWLTIDIDGQELHGTGTYAAQYDVSHDRANLSLAGPATSDMANIYVQELSQKDPTTIDCSSENFDFNLSISLASNEIPVEWRGTSFSRSGCSDEEDVVTAYELDFTTVQTDRLVGTFLLTVEGSDSREGSTLHVTGKFDEELDEN